MSEVFRVRRGIRNTGMQGLCFWLVFAVGLVVYAALDENFVGVQKIGVIAFGLGGTVWWFALGVWLLIFHRRHRLGVDDGGITCEGVRRARSLDWSDVASAQWRLCPAGGSVLLRGPSGKIVIEFSIYEGERRLRLIQGVRAAVPETKQSGWDLFCHRVAVPIAKASDEPGEDDVVLTRRRWDCYLVPLMLAVAAAGAYYWWRLDDARLLLGGIVLVPFWLLQRYRTPATGLVTRRMSGGEKSFLRFVLVCGAVGVAAILLLVVFEASVPHAQWLAGAIGLGLMTLVVLRGCAEDRRRREQDLAAAPRSVREWETIGAVGEVGRQSGAG